MTVDRELGLREAGPETLTPAVGRENLTLDYKNGILATDRRSPAGRPVRKDGEVPCLLTT